MAGKSDSNQRPILIIKKKGHGDHGHHGGAWKVAYADFVTAMMAFFLLLWLLNVTTEEQRLGIANYFMPESVSRSQSGGGGVLGGTTVSPGEMNRVAGGLTMSIPRAPDASESEEAQDEDGEGKMPERNDPKVPGQRVMADGHKDKDHDKTKDKDHDKTKDKDHDKTKDKDGEQAKDTGKDQTPASERVREAAERQVKEMLAKQEEESFKKAEFDLRQAIQDIPELKQLAENLIVDRTPEGLRIQIVDQGRFSMFPLGSAQPLEHTRKLLGMVVRVVQKLPNRIAVTGHTDSLPFQNANGTYGNWELSTDRANSSRRMLADSGLGRERISRVVGMADQDPLFKENPADPRNRRISIVLLRENPA
jgi:chemotaxis protein MotB